MTQEQKNTANATSYLFGELGQSERDTFEDRLFSDEDSACFLHAVEKDLIDDYVRGEMDSAVRQRFEQHYLISESRRKKVGLAVVLQNEVLIENEIPLTLAPDSKGSLWQSLVEFVRFSNLVRVGAIAAILMLVLFGALMFLRQPPSAPEIVRDANANRPAEIPVPPNVPDNLAANDNANNKPSILGSQTPDKKPSTTVTPDKEREVLPPASQPRIFVATLLPPTRSGEMPVFMIPKNAESIQLRIVHDNFRPFVKYRTQIRSQIGSVIFNREIPVDEKNPARPITLFVKASAFKAGTYELILSGITAAQHSEEIKFYNFTVTKK